MKSASMFMTTILLLFVLVLPSSGQRGAGGGRAGGGAAVRSGAAVSGPYGGGAVGTRTSAAGVGPRGGTWQGGTGSGSRTTQGGATIDYRGGAARGSGPGGGRGAGYAGGVQVTTPGGQEYTKVGRGGAAVGPGGNAVGGRSSIGVGSGPNGTAASISRQGTAIGPNGAVHGGYRGGVAVGPQGVVAGRTGGAVATGPGGTAAVAGRGGVAVGPYGAVAGGSRVGVATGPGGTMVAGGYRAGAARYGTYHVSGAALRTQGAYVRRGFVGYNCFTPGWYARYPGAWFAAGWTAGAAWRAATWPVLAGYCSYPAQPIYYDFGSTVVYDSGTVYVNGDPIASAEEYAQQAVDLADLGRQAQASNDDDWQPIGVFAMVQGEEQTAYNIFQLAINKRGVIRGNYYNALADSTEPVYGSVDQKTQLAAWTVANRKTPVYEAGIANLTQDETTMLVHFGKDKTEQFSLVRIEKANEGEP